MNDFEILNEEEKKNSIPWSIIIFDRFVFLFYFFVY